MEVHVKTRRLDQAACILGDARPTRGARAGPQVARRAAPVYEAEP
jgi:hypothetical protein